MMLDARAQYQSDVTTLPLVLPDGQRPPVPPHDTYDTHIALAAPLYDPSVAPRRLEERARTAETAAQLRTTLFGLRLTVIDAYFSATLAGAQAEQVELSIEALAAQLQAAEQRVQAGTALPSDAAALEAELLRRRQDHAALEANRQAALNTLSDLTGQRLAPDAALALPTRDAPLPGPALVDSIRARPEYAQFRRTQERLLAQQATLDAVQKPHVSAFARTAYGRPGLNMLSSNFDIYWLAGIEAQWTPWTWGATDRSREVLQVQQQLVEAEEASFARTLQRSLENDRADVEWLDSAVASDDSIVVLRERILHETTLRFREGVVTAAELIDRRTDALGARLTKVAHVVRRARARARYLTTLGLEVR